MCVYIYLRVEAEVLFGLVVCCLLQEIYDDGLDDDGDSFDDADDSFDCKIHTCAHTLTQYTHAHMCTHTHS